MAVIPRVGSGCSATGLAASLRPRLAQFPGCRPATLESPTFRAMSVAVTLSAADEDVYRKAAIHKYSTPTAAVG